MEAAGVRKHDVELFVEAEMTDSVTGEVLARGVREAKGVDVKGKAQLTLEDAKPQIDQWGKALEQMVAIRKK